MQIADAATTSTVAQTAADAAGALPSAWQVGVRLVFFVVLVAALVYLAVYMRKRFPIVAEFMVFLKERKLWWMTPIVVVFFLLALLIVTMGGPLAPFLYPFF